MTDPQPIKGTEEKTIEYPKDKLTEETSSPKEGEEKTIEYPLPYAEMEKALKSHDALRKSTTPSKDSSTDEEEK